MNGVRHAKAQPNWLVGSGHAYRSALESWISTFKLFCKNSEQSLKWVVRNSLDKIWVILNRPACQPLSSTFLILKPSCRSSHPYLTYPQISEQSLRLSKQNLGGFGHAHHAWTSLRAKHFEFQNPLAQFLIYIYHIPKFHNNPSTGY